MVSLELYDPTFAKPAHPVEMRMPADDYCFNYANSKGAAPLTREHAMCPRNSVVARIRREGLSAQAARLVKQGSPGYPAEEDFPHFAAGTYFPFATVQDTMPPLLVYGSELRPIRLTLRRRYVTDGQGHRSHHYDVISCEAPTIKTYEELTATKLDRLREFLQSCMRADRSIGNTALIGMLEETHGAPATNRTMTWWRARNKPVKSTPCADLQLNEACDAYDTLFGPSSEAPLEAATANAVVSIDDTDSTIPARIELAVGNMDIGGIGDMPNSAHEAIVRSAIAVDGVMGTLTAGAKDAVGVAIAGGVIAEGTIIKGRPLYGPNMDPDHVFKSTGTMHGAHPSMVIKMAHLSDQMPPL